MRETRLRRLARERGLLPHQKFAPVFHAAARELGYSGLQISSRQWDRWLAGTLKGLPYAKAQECLEHIFARPAAALFETAGNETDRAPGRDTSVVDITSLPPVGRSSSDSDPFVNPVSMRELMMIAQEQSRSSAADAERAIGRTTMEQLESDVTNLARVYLARSPVVLFPAILEVRSRVIARLEETRRPDQLRDLNFLAGVASSLLAECAIDLGQIPASVDHARAAWAYAAAIDHVPLAVWARSMMATSAYWADQPRDAVKAIQRGHEHRPVGVSAARLYSVSARAYSHLGDVDRTISAIRAANHARAGHQGGDELQDTIGGVFDWDQAREQRCFSTALLTLLSVRQGDLNRDVVEQLTAEILAHGDRALAAATATPDEERSAPLEATIHIDRASALLLLGDLTGGMEALSPVLDLAPDLRTYPVTYRVRALQVPLTQLSRTSRPARDLGDALVAFAAGSTVRALP